MTMTPPSRRSRGRRAPMAEINVTPMVDVVLVLLIIFMVTAPLLAAGVPVNLPQASAKPLEQDTPVAISLEADGRVFVEDKAVAPAALGDALQRVAARRVAGKPPQVFLRADRTLAYGRVMRVMGALQTAGLTRVALVTTGEEAP
jgi:biopolymer transport protein TolR